jgi:hypothetical protein
VWQLKAFLSHHTHTHTHTHVVSATSLCTYAHQKYVVALEGASTERPPFHIMYLALTRTIYIYIYIYIYIRCVYAIFGREITIYSHIRCKYTVLANLTYTCVLQAPHLTYTCVLQAPHLTYTCVLQAPYLTYTCVLQAPHNSASPANPPHR